MKRQGALSVLDLTDERGRLCCRLLADMGAEVVRVEKPETLRRLVKTADVLVESFAPGYLPSLGLGYPQLAQINPRLVMASITPFGQSGPYRDYKSCDIVASALGGQMYVCGEPSSPPLKPFGNQSYYLGSLFAAIGVLLALWHRRSSGKGQHIDISLQEGVASALDHVLVRYFYQGAVAERRGSLYWNGAFNIFPCKDGYILLSLFHQWETLVEWLASEGMAEDLTRKKWLDRDYRFQHLDHVIEVLTRWTKNHAVAELVEKGQAMRFPWAEVVSISKLLSSPQLEARNFRPHFRAFCFPYPPAQ